MFNVYLLSYFVCLERFRSSVMSSGASSVVEPSYEVRAHRPKGDKHPRPTKHTPFTIYPAPCTCFWNTDDTDSIDFHRFFNRKERKDFSAFCFLPPSSYLFTIYLLIRLLVHLFSRPPFTMSKR